MDKYIERSDAVQCARDVANDFRTDGFAEEAGAADMVGDLLQDFPAADVRPVVKALWTYTNMSRLVCSNCGNPVAFALKDDGWHHGDYCPNCGADMRGGEAGE